MRRALFILPVLLCVTAACVQAQSAAQDSLPAGFRELSFDEFTRHHFAADLPVRFRMPAEYVPVAQTTHRDQTYWMSTADSTAQAADPEVRMKDGFYSVRLSLSLGYDQDRRMFMGADGDETMLADAYTKGGFTDVTVERYDVNGYPVLFVEAGKDGRRATIVYVAALVETNSIVAFYSAPSPAREVDRVRWATLKRGILGSGPSRRIR
ncbi:MAG: hypothetical protein JWM27_2007 [Gemmatimonadetes bacterium]|nr:hypothetical protein [Gemmatimonadota bacterium]